MDAYEAIKRRVSVRAFLPAEVGRDVIERLIGAAVRAPNHKLTEPWRFTVLTGAARDRYAEIRKAHRAKKFPDPVDPASARAIEKTWREHLETPAFIVVMCQTSEDAVRREEDYAATMMAAQNLLVAASAEGLGTYIRTGGIMDLPEVRELARAPQDYRIVAIVSLGYPAQEEAPRKRTDASLKTDWIG